MKLGANLKFLAKPIRKIQIQCFQRSYMVPFALCLCVVQSSVADFPWGHAPYRHLLTRDTSPRQTKVQIQPKHRWANEFCWGTSRNMSKGLLTGTGRTRRHQHHQSPLQHGWQLTKAGNWEHSAQPAGSAQVAQLIPASFRPQFTRLFWTTKQFPNH